MPKKILFLTHKIGIGGAEQRLIDFLRHEVNNKALSLQVLCLEDKGVIGDEITKLGGNISVLRQKSLFGKIKELRRFLKKEKPDIVHIQLCLARAYTILIKLFSTANVFYTVEDQLDGMTRFDRKLEKVFYYFTDAIIAVSVSVKNTYCKRIGVNGNKVITIYNGVNLSSFYNEPSASGYFKNNQCFSADDILITTVARLVKKKGHIYLIKAAKILAQKYPNLKFVFVGDGPHRQFILDEICKEKLEQFFVLTGWKRNIADILSSTSIFVLASTVDEGQGIAVVEAMAAAKPIVVTDIVGINEVANSSNSILVPPEDHVALAKAIEELIHDKEKRIKLGQEARSQALEKFSLKQMCESYEKLYLDCVKKRHAQNILRGHAERHGSQGLRIAKERHSVTASKHTTNILYFETSSGYGGSANALTLLLKNIKKDSYYPVVMMSHDGPQFKKIRDLGIEVIKYPYADLYEGSSTRLIGYIKFICMFFLKALPGLWYICRIIESKKIDVVHVNTNIYTGVPAIIAAKLKKIRCICHIRATRPVSSLERFLLKWIDRVIVLNKDTKITFEGLTPKGGVALIYDGIECNGDHLNTSITRDGTKPVIGIVGRIVRGKGHKEFVLTAKKILNKYPNARFCIIGDSNGSEELYHRETIDLVKNEGMEQSVRFTGWHDNIYAAMAELDFLIQPYTNAEGLPNVIIEAMSLKKPVISTDVSGPKEIILDKKTGYIVPKGNVAMLAEKALELINNPRLLRHMGDNAYNRVSEVFDIRQTTKEIMDLYQEVLN